MTPFTNDSDVGNPPPVTSVQGGVAGAHLDRAREGGNGTSPEGDGDARGSTGPPPGNGLRRSARARARPIVVLLDTAGLAAAFLIAWALVGLGVTPGVENQATRHHLGLWMFAYLPAYLVGLAAYGLYRRERRRLFNSSFPDLVSLAHGLAAGGVATVAASHLLRRFGHVDPAISLTGVVLMSAPALLTIPVAR